ncbi:RNase adapter RapZ [Desulfitobacterium sp.]|uniref:RNase adapter RapZ n=1 Tax=Desulfitobacterium sp. TaxID=49981 RepID=UPI0039C8A5C0
MKLLVITGLSGAGKTQVLQCLEDQGYFCIDNLPPTFIVKFVELCAQSQGKVSKAAIVCDLRGGEFFTSLAEAFKDLDKEGFRYEILFLEASDEALVRRYKESRRRHPLSPQGRLLEGINEERKLLAELRGQAHKVIDTSNLLSKQLRQQITELYGEGRGQGQLAVSVISFGFKYGVPLDVDLLIDVRFLPNPFYVEELRPLTGEHPLVQNYVLENPVAQEFMKRYLHLLEYILPYYVKEGKSHLVIGVGCTGGQHRSVAIAEKIGLFLKEQHFTMSVKHRDAARNRRGETMR